MNFSSFPIGTFSFSTGGIIFLLGLVAATWMLSRTVHERGLSLTFLHERLLPLAFISFLIGRIGEIGKFWSYFQSTATDISFGEEVLVLSKRFVMFWHQGVDPFWTAIGFLGAFFVFAIRKKENLWQWMDAFVLPTIMLLIFWKLGAFFSGWDYGKPIAEDFWLSITYDIQEVRYSVPLHPVQLYDLAYYLLLFFLGLHWRHSAFEKKDGTFFVYTIFFVFLGNGFLEFFRGDPVPMIYINDFEIRMSQLLSFVLSIGFAFFLIFHTHPEFIAHGQRRRRLRTRPPDITKENSEE